MAVWNTKDEDTMLCPKGILKAEWKLKIKQKWKDKSMHGQYYPRQMAELTDEPYTYIWIKTTRLKIETVALIIAAQEQALNTKAHLAQILKIRID